MKKFVLSLALIASISIAHAQVYLNEFYVRPQSNESEFFELFNNSNATVSLSCYTLITYFNDGNDRGFYVINFPSTATISPYGFYVGAEANPFNFQAGTANANLNYTTSGTATKYIEHGGTYTAVTSGTDVFKDIFLKSSAGNGNNGVYAMFLYNNGTLVDGFLGANNNNTVPNYITNMKPITNTNSCGSHTYDFSTLNDNPALIANVNPAAGTDNGYYRLGNGRCQGLTGWVKSSSPSEHTPGYSNTGTTNTGGGQTFTINAQCTGNTVNYTISGGTSNDYPITLTLYNDANGNGVLDATDVAISNTKLTYNSSGNTGSLSNPNMYAYLLLGLATQQPCSDTVRALQCPAGIALPVSLKSFNVKRAGNSVSLTWETVTEISNTGFYIQRLIGNGGWETLGFVPTQATGGNSSSLLSYSYSDLNTAKGVTQYRLRQVDNNGAAKYSEIRTVRSNDLPSKVILYPNPSNTGNVNVIFDDASVLRDIFVSDMSGRVIKQWKNISNNNLQIENLNPGIYTVRIVDTQAGTQTTEKFVVNR